jgi:hypothetical protein
MNTEKCMKNQRQYFVYLFVLSNDAVIVLVLNDKMLTDDELEKTRKKAIIPKLKHYLDLLLKEARKAIKSQSG